MKYRNRFLYFQNLNKEGRLILLSTFEAKGKNFLQIAIAKPYVATANRGIAKIMKALTNKFEYQSFSHLIKEYVGSSNIC